MLICRDPEPSLVPPCNARAEREWDKYIRAKEPLKRKLTSLENELEDAVLCLEDLKLLDKGLQARCLELIREDYGIRIEHTKRALEELESWR